MAEPSITPYRITKPIQLLAAWLAGLAIVNAAFLTAAGAVRTPSWIPGLLAIAAVVNVPLFLLSLFLLQTKFRPEMQEDTFYSKYLERKYSTPPTPAQPVDLEKELKTVADRIVSQIAETTTNKEEQVVQILKESGISQFAARFRDSRTLSELHLYPNLWPELVDSWRESKDFQQEVEDLVEAGLLEVPNRKLLEATLTPVGTEVAKWLQDKNYLWNQKHERHMISK